MRNFQHKRDWKDILHSKPVLAFLGLLVLFFAWGVVGFLGKMEETRKNKINAENQVAELQAQETNLSSSIDKLNTPEGVEASIRDKFGLAKDGEGLIVIVDDKNATPPPAEKTGGFLGFLFFWKNWFK